jgi:hypothetical protein
MKSSNWTHDNNPHELFSGEKFDSLSLHNRLHFFPAQNEAVLFSAIVLKTSAANSRSVVSDRQRHFTIL